MYIDIDIKFYGIADPAITGLIVLIMDFCVCDALVVSVYVYLFANTTKSHIFFLRRL